MKGYSPDPLFRLFSIIFFIKSPQIGCMVVNINHLFDVSYHLDFLIRILVHSLFQLYFCLFFNRQCSLVSLLNNFIIRFFHFFQHPFHSILQIPEIDVCAIENPVYAFYGLWSWRYVYLFDIRQILHEFGN